MKATNAPHQPPPDSVVPVERARGRLWLSLAAAGGLGLLELFRLRFQHRKVYKPSPLPPAVHHDLHLEDIQFPSKNGAQLHGWWLPHARPKGSILFCHGNKGNLTTQVDALEKLQTLQMNILAFDYQGYGESEGSPSEKALLGDGRAAYDYLVREKGEDPSRILIFGHSLGGAVAIDLAYHRPEAAGLVAQSTFTCLKDMAKHGYPRLPMHLITSDHFKSIERVPHIGMPKLFVHGLEDKVIPWQFGHRLFETAAPPRRWLEIRGGGHRDLPFRGSLRYLWELVLFRNECLDNRLMVDFPPQSKENK